ncbi:acetyl-CoA hydrolase/transferase C-terminal domain-containing protein [Cytophagales bacterium LB-30]|uniref:Acetyl-CoA hydrolase/transferase C-terminal domain-containing protein n=1 Tax=Shiella aurantiaca TaxID=3058365 RepID=A0ABT8F434_9BACT|nr:acetyl-CoA hydrolase/transferase C-terminal domain-containing protein [Shiella aurantiaca]MDN4165029.1 acetyl-CoA hydrolase/transferase C-terminal domain-containing protein [Shiella aurantiaca]
MICSAQEAISHIQSHQAVFVHSVAAVPEHLVAEMVNQHARLKGVQIYQLHTEGEAPYAAPAYQDSFFVNAFFIGANVRKAINEGRGSYIPVFLSEVPRLFRQEVVKLDVALISVSPPDAHGYCSLGPSVDASRAAIEKAKIVIAQVNKHMPRTLGDANIHSSQINYMVPFDQPIHAHEPAPLSATDRQIGAHVANLVDNGATLQMGIGSIPNAVLANLMGHQDLGIHTEMFSDGVLPLVEKGVITGLLKKKHRGKIVATFVMGSQKVYDFIDNNPAVVMLDAQYVNDTAIIRQNPKVTAINSAIEIDLTGQVCADSIGQRMYSGVGGQMDFIRGASLSEGGKAIIALPSTTKQGISRICTTLKEGAGVVTTRAHVHYVVTEYGVAHLYGRNLRDRAKALIAIAHPDHQESLARAAGL